MSNVEIFHEFGPNYGYVEETYRLYQQDPSLVSEKWGKFFENAEKDLNVKPVTNGQTTSHQVKVIKEETAVSPIASVTGRSVADERLQESVYRLVYSYRNYGHFHAAINPLDQGIEPLPQIARLDPDYYNFTSEQLETEVLCYRFQGREKIKLKDLLAELKKVYCGSIGFEYQHILNESERYWLREQIENRHSQGYVYTTDQKVRRLQKVIDAEVFEDELHKRYLGQKRFSLEGGETLIPMLADIIEQAAEFGQKEVVMGMAHRGRLSVLRNIFGKPLKQIFYEFEDNSIYAALGSGDVKYHMGFVSNFETPKGKVKVSLAPNPSHLEFVYPVIEGITRAKQDLEHNSDRNSVVPVIMHGDAAVIGQGVVTETLNFAYVKGFNTGGTIHLVINNQIGFTTTPDESRSSTYCTEFAKAIQAPILHVNCEDVIAACWAAHLALEYRNKFGKDIVIDLYCYRKYGHNEGDDPTFTQPLLYKNISAKKKISELFEEQLVSQGEITTEQVQAYKESYKKDFNEQQTSLRPPLVMGEACPIHGRLRVQPQETAASTERLLEAGADLIAFPEGFHPNPKLKGILEKRFESLKTNQEIDWGTAETLSYATLLQQGINVRLTGQDAGRGTFSHRQVLINDSITGDHYLTYEPIIKKTGSKFEVYNSVLSECAVMGFEFGYSTEAKNSLVIWEAQFGDFSNGAQVIIDQFLSSSEQKWHQLSGLTLLLPHGFEGQGPEHSSARLERYLQLCADGNMVVCYPTNAAQCFHLLRRQALSPLKRPMIVMTPKSLLRAKEATCKLENLTEGTFETILVNDFGKITKNASVVFTSGKAYYDIAKSLAQQEKANTRVIRIEQLYPFPQYEIKKAIKDLKTEECVWVQEEPLNMGAWLYIEPYLRERLGFTSVQYAGRAVSASPSTGSPKRHAFEQQTFIKEMLGLL